MPARAVTIDDVDRVTETIRLAFLDDPVWGPALRRTDGRSLDLGAYWRLFVLGSVRFRTARMTDDEAAAAIWLPPPAEPELSEPLNAELEALIARDLDEPALEALHTLFERFEASRADRPPHAYLSLLATSPAFRGQGRGQQLLAENLAEWDAAGVPCSLESTNPANDHRYVRLGFRPEGGFSAVRDGAWISVMWRPAGG